MASVIAQMAVNAVVMGSLYALMGVSWSIIVRATKTFHFAHGFVFVCASYGAVLIVSATGLPLVVGFAVAIVTAMIVGCGIEVLLYRPLRKSGATTFVVFVASLGTMVLGTNLVQMIFGPNNRAFNFATTRYQVGSTAFTSLHVLIVIVSLATIAAVKLFLKVSRTGKAVRALASNPEMAETIGIDTKTTRLVVFALGSAVVAVGAVLYGLKYAVNPSVGMTPLMIGFIVTFLGGIGSIHGALLGGFVLSVSENLLVSFVPSQYSILVSFGLLLIVIIARPRGLFEPD